jgi:DDE superfamily endonuclease
LAKQKVVVETTLAFDEFAVSTRPNTSYGWAQKNTRPQVKSDERKREKINGLLAIDLITAKEYLQFKSVAKTENIADYFLDLTLDLFKANPNLKTINCFLDNNPTHKKKLDDFYKQHNISTRLPKIDFYYFAPYSPDDNPVEYCIRLIQQLALHHLPQNTTLEQIQTKLQSKIQTQQFLTPTKLQNILKHIYAL